MLQIIQQFFAPVKWYLNIPFCAIRHNKIAVHTLCFGTKSTIKFDVSCIFTLPRKKIISKNRKFFCAGFLRTFSPVSKKWTNTP